MIRIWIQYFTYRDVINLSAQISINRLKLSVFFTVLLQTEGKRCFGVETKCHKMYYFTFKASKQGTFLEFDHQIV